GHLARCVECVGGDRALLHPLLQRRITLSAFSSSRRGPESPSSGARSTAARPPTWKGEALDAGRRLLTSARAEARLRSFGLIQRRFRMPPQVGAAKGGGHRLRVFRPNHGPRIDLAGRAWSLPYGRGLRVGRLASCWFWTGAPQGSFVNPGPHQGRLIALESGAERPRILGNSRRARTLARPLMPVPRPPRNPEPGTETRGPKGTRLGSLGAFWP